MILLSMVNCCWFHACVTVIVIIIMIIDNNFIFIVVSPSSSSSSSLSWSSSPSSSSSSSSSLSNRLIRMIRFYRLYRAHNFAIIFLPDPTIRYFVEPVWMDNSWSDVQYVHESHYVKDKHLYSVETNTRIIKIYDLNLTDTDDGKEMVSQTRCLASRIWRLPKPEIQHMFIVDSFLWNE